MTQVDFSVAGHPGMKLMYITRDPDVARVLERCGVDWVFVDLEVMGKADRQSGRNTVISAHSVDDVAAVRAVLSTSKLLVRVNPWGGHSPDEIESVIQAGADIVMLPFFTSREEVAGFVDAVAGRAGVCLLMETPAAVDNVDSILDVPGIDYIHIGLNDLHIAYGMSFMFEPLADGTVERLCRKFAEKGIAYGVGGMAGVGKLTPPAEEILAEHYRLGSGMVILSRSFYNLDAMQDLGGLEDSFSKGVDQDRECEGGLGDADAWFCEENRKRVAAGVGEVARNIAERRKQV